MRRSVRPSFPNAITCCFFSSLKTLLMPPQPTWLRRSQCPGRYLSLAGFEVTFIGRFWVTAEVTSYRSNVAVRIPLPTCNGRRSGKQRSKIGRKETAGGSKVSHFVFVCPWFRRRFSPIATAAQYLFGGFEMSVPKLAKMFAVIPHLAERVQNEAVNAEAGAIFLEGIR
jgi:hypothetical protein